MAQKLVQIQANNQGYRGWKSGQSSVRSFAHSRQYAPKKSLSSKIGISIISDDIDILSRPKESQKDGGPNRDSNPGPLAEVKGRSL